jgi:hypothetical protein
MGLQPWESEFDDDEKSDDDTGIKCQFCKGDLAKTIGCTLSVFVHKGKEYERFKVGGAGDFFEGVDSGIEQHVVIAVLNTGIITTATVIVSIALCVVVNCLLADVKSCIKLSDYQMTENIDTVLVKMKRKRDTATEKESLMARLEEAKASKINEINVPIRGNKRSGHER